MNMDCVSGLIAGTAATALAAVTLDGASVNVETVAKIAVPIAGMVWWLGSRFTQIDARLKNIEEALKKCPMNKGSSCEASD